MNVTFEYSRMLYCKLLDFTQLKSGLSWSGFHITFQQTSQGNMFFKIHFILYCGNLSYWNYIWWRQTLLNMMCHIMWELFLLCKSSVPLCCSDHWYCNSAKTCASKDKQLLVSTGFTNKSRLANSYSNYITVGNEHFTPRSTLFCLLTFLKVETKYCHSSRSTRTV